MHYLKGTINLGLVYAGKTISVCISANARHGLYHDGKGQYATVVKVGNNNNNFLNETLSGALAKFKRRVCIKKHFAMQPDCASLDNSVESLLH